jgi:hypothetical protein
MGRAVWIAGLGLVAALVACDHCAAETIELLTLEVLTMDEVGVPADTLQQAQQVASRIFEGVGIRLVWISRMPLGSRYLVIRVVLKPMSVMSRNPGVLGTAAASNDNGATLASLFFERIDRQCGRFGIDVSLLLGHVMAHEMGHLLLPPGAHTAAGLMKAGWDLHQSVLALAGKLTFAPNQSSLIRTRLQRANEPLTPNPSGVGLALFDPVSRLQVHGRESPGPKEGRNGPNNLDRHSGARCGIDLFEQSHSRNN